MHECLALIYGPLMYFIKIHLIIFNENASIKIQVEFWCSYCQYTGFMSLSALMN